MLEPAFRSSESGQVEMRPGGCSPVKPEVRVLGIDDAPFSFEDETTDVVGVVTRGASYVEAVLRTQVEVDGSDATERLLGVMRDSRYREQLRIVMIDGAALGGFNVVDLDRLHAQLGVPVMTFTRDKPDFAAIEAALRKYFADWEARLSLLERYAPSEVETDHNPVYVKAVGLTEAETREALRRTTIRGVVPEPLRLAHLIATAYKRGESHGRP